MNTTTITFSDSSHLILSNEDYIVPIIYSDDENNSASQGMPFHMEWNVHSGLIPCLLTFFKQHDYFFINDDCNCVYNSKSIVKITVDE